MKLKLSRSSEFPRKSERANQTAARRSLPAPRRGPGWKMTRPAIFRENRFRAV